MKLAVWMLLIWSYRKKINSLYSGQHQPSELIPQTNISGFSCICLFLLSLALRRFVYISRNRWIVTVWLNVIICGITDSTLSVDGRPQSHVFARIFCCLLPRSINENLKILLYRCVAAACDASAFRSDEDTVTDSFPCGPLCNWPLQAHMLSRWNTHARYKRVKHTPCVSISYNIFCFGYWLRHGLDYAWIGFVMHLIVIWMAPFVAIWKF